MHLQFFVLKTLFGRRRAADIRLRARHKKSTISHDLFCGILAIGLLTAFITQAYTTTYEIPAVATTTPTVGKEVRIIVKINWTPERIEQEIRETFPEDPETAVKIAKCESGLDADIQSYHIINGERERSFGVFQIFSPVWHQTALRLGYTDYKTDPGDNIAMARYIYEQAGKRWTDWTCYNKKMI